MHLPADGRPLVAACYVVRDRQLLMVRRRFRDGAPEWTGPRGNVEPGETPEEAAVREVKEEVGLTVEVVRRLGERVHPATGRHLIYLVCRIVAGDATVVDHEEVTAVEWCDLRTVLERWSGLNGGIHPAVRECLEPPGVEVGG
jgi:8-oxo-dGTP diphosphatase